jgi:hypothetical protein
VIHLSHEIRQQSDSIRQSTIDNVSLLRSDFSDASKVHQNRLSALQEQLSELQNETAAMTAKLHASQDSAISTEAILTKAIANLQLLTARVDLSLRQNSDEALRMEIRPIRIHFFFQAPEVWSTWESIWESCRAHACIEPVIVLVPMHHDGAVDEMRGRRFLADQGLPFIDVSAYQLSTHAPDIVFLQNPYESTRPLELAVERLLQQGVRIVYVPYGLDVGGGADNLKWQYDLEVHRKAWRIFVRSADHKRMYGMLCQPGNHHVIVAGHPKIDKIVAHHQMATVESLSNAPRKVILWTPHFSVEPNGWSTFTRHFESILSFFEAGPKDVTLLIRPHPFFFGRLKQYEMPPDFTEDAIRRRIINSPYIQLDEQEQYIDSFSKSHALMADAGSFLLEYLPTGKPILYLHNEDGPGLNETGDFVSDYYQADDFGGIQRFIQMVASGKDENRESRLARIETLLHRTDGKVGQAIVDHVVENFRPSFPNHLATQTLGASGS